MFPRKSRSSLATGAVARLCLTVVLCGLAGACAPASFLITPVSGDRGLTEFTVEREGRRARDKIAIIDVEGVISSSRSTPLIGDASQSMVASIVEQLDHAAADPRVRAIILRLNTPGGAVTASDVVYSEVMRFRKKTGRPVVAMMMDTCASGGYYIACAADEVIAYPTTVTGSIGVVMVLPDLSAAMGKLGIGVNVVRSGARKDSGSPFRVMRSEERATFQGMIDAMYNRFVDIVVQARSLPVERVRTLADGRVYVGTEALENGLVDRLGTLRDAISRARHLSGTSEKSVRIIQYARTHAHRANIYAQAPATPTTVTVINVDLPSFTGGAPTMSYLWMPEWGVQ